MQHVKGQSADKLLEIKIINPRFVSVSSVASNSSTNAADVVSRGDRRWLVSWFHSSAEVAACWCQFGRVC